MSLPDTGWSQLNSFAADAALHITDETQGTSREKLFCKVTLAAWHSELSQTSTI